MKHWPSQLFPIVILALLAGLTFWLQSRVAADITIHDGKLRHDPDAIAENFVARRFDQTGQLKYRLTAPYLVHYPDDDTSEITSPTLTSYRPKTPPVTVTADRAKLTAGGEIAYLRDNVRLSRAAMRGMMKRRHGRIIGITSVVGVTGNGGQTNYAASKAGMIGFTKSLAQEVASRNITVNCIAPGFIATPMTDVLKDDQKEGLLKGIPAGRLGTGADIAAAALYLASDESAYVTGQTLHVNGGMAMI